MNCFTMILKVFKGIIKQSRTDSVFNMVFIGKPRRLYKGRTDVCTSLEFRGRELGRWRRWNIWFPNKPLKIGSDQIRQNQIHVQRNERKLRFLKEECGEEGRLRSDNANSKLERAIGSLFESSFPMKLLIYLKNIFSK